MTMTPDDRMITSKGCKIYIPAWYTEKGLANISVDKYILGVYAIVVEDSVYAVNSVMAMMQITPDQTNRVKIDGDEYLEFVFNANSTVVPNTNLVKVDTLTYVVFDAFIQKGNVPVFMDYEDLGNIFNTSLKYAGTRVGSQREVTQLIVSTLARNPNDRKEYYRQGITTEQDKQKVKPDFVSLMSIPYSATNTMTKLGGSYFSQGVVSALVSPSTRPERIETILRK